jgi:hypothetical protein
MANKDNTISKILMGMIVVGGILSHLGEPSEPSTGNSGQDNSASVSPKKFCSSPQIDETDRQLDGGPDILCYI